MRSIAHRCLPMLLALGTLLACAPAASAAYVLTTAPDYTVGTIQVANCNQLGQSDENGVFYTICGTNIRRYDRNGVRLADIPIPAGIPDPVDVAPSPDGTFLYVSQNGAKTPRRLINWGHSGTYVLDPNWKLADLVYWNQHFAPVGGYLATDGRGDIYLSNGSYWAGATQSSIGKYSPDGKLITAFGDYGKQDGNWITNQDVAVTRDGRRVYVGENCGKACNYEDPNYQGSRITRYDFTAGGTYRFTRQVAAAGPMDGNRFPRCQSDGAVHSAYSLSLDFWENLYVTSTTCGRIQKFATFADPAKDVFVKTVATWTDESTPSGIKGMKNHFIASDLAGRLFAAQWSRVFTPKTLRVPAMPLPALPPLPAPDIVAPVITNVTVPATTPTQDVAVTTTATDAVGVAEMRLATEAGEWGPWQPFSSPVTHRSSAGKGVKGVYVQVRDMAGNESASVYRTYRWEDGGGVVDPPPGGGADAADPVLASITVPPLTATRDVTVAVEATDDVGVRQMRLANEDGNWGAWRAFAAASTWQLSAGVGAKAVYVQVRDAAGRESGTLMARTRYTLDAPVDPPPGGGDQPDTVAPVLASITLPAEVAERTVTVTTAATDAVGVAQVRFANEDGNWTAWQAWAPTKQWTLSDGYGAKLVYGQVRDAAGNESLVLNVRTNRTRTVAGPGDAADPVLRSVTIPNPTPTANVTVTLDATDDVGVTQVRFANEDGNWGAWGAYAAQVPHTLTAGKTLKAVYAQVRDASGRESNVLFVRTLVN